MADRRAADDVQRLERGRRLRALVADGTLTEHDVDAVWTYLAVRERLARAEQALADIASNHWCARCEYSDPCYTMRTALRASQGGQ